MSACRVYTTPSFVDCLLVFFFVSSLSLRCKPTDFLGPRLLVAHVAKGLYAVQLRRWFTLFGHENMKVNAQSEFLTWCLS